MDDPAFGQQELDKVLAGIARRQPLPASAPVVRSVAGMSGDQHAVHALAAMVLADAALTERVLRAANAAAMGIVGGVRAVTQGVFVLGFDTVRTIALSLPTLDQIEAPAQRELLGLELAHAAAVACLARELAGRAGYDAEQAAVLGLMRSIGRLAAAAWAPQGHLAVRERARREGVPESDAARRLLGRPFHAIAQLAVRTWGFDEAFAAAIGREAADCHGPAFAAALAAQIVEAAAQAGSLQAPRPQALADAAADVLQARVEALRDALSDAHARIVALCDALSLPDPIDAHARASLQRLHDAALAPASELVAAAPRGDMKRMRDGRGGRPRSGRELLRAGIAALAQAASQGEPAAARLERAMDAIHHAMGFRRSVLAVLDAGAGVFLPRAARGADADAILRGWSLPASGRNLLLAAIERDVSLNIADAGADKIRASLPADFARHLTDVRSFVLVPLRDAAGPVGFFYGDRATPDGLTDADDIRLLVELTDALLPALRRDA